MQAWEPSEIVFVGRGASPKTAPPHKEKKSPHKEKKRPPYRYIFGFPGEGRQTTTLATPLLAPIKTRKLEQNINEETSKAVTWLQSN